MSYNSRFWIFAYFYDNPRTGDRNGFFFERKQKNGLASLIFMLMLIFYVKKWFLVESQNCRPHDKSCLELN